MKVVVLIVALAAYGVAPVHAQLIGKIPPAPAPSPEYKPPAPPAPVAPAKPTEPEKPLPSLVVKDADGKIKRYPQGAERAAIEIFGFDDEAKKKIEASSMGRRADVERMVVEKLPQVIEACKTRDKMDQINDVGEFSRIKEVAGPLAVEKMTDRLLRDAAISPVQRSRLDQIVKEYEDELKKEWQGGTGNDVLKILNVVAKEKFTEVTRDALEAYDGLLVKAAPAAASMAGELKLTPEQAASADAATKMDDKKKVDAMAALVASLSAEQQKALLGKVITPK